MNVDKWLESTWPLVFHFLRAGLMEPGAFVHAVKTLSQPSHMLSPAQASHSQ